MAWWGRSPEDRELRKIRLQSGRLLCTYAGLPHTEARAKLIAQAIRAGEKGLLNKETWDRLNGYPRSQLMRLADDILD